MRAARRHLAAGLFAIACSVLMTWPLAAGAGHHVLRAAYYWDAYTNTMILGNRVNAALGRGPLSLYDASYFAPLPRAIVFNENLFGLSLLFAPFYLLGHDPIWAYNLTLLLSLSLSTFFTYLLVRRLTGSGYAGLLAGVAFAFCPFVMFEAGRIQLVATQWIPAAFLLLQRAIEERRLRDIIGFWLCIVLQIGTCLYNTMFLVPLLALAGSILLVRERPPWRFYLWFGAAALAAGALALLMVFPYFSARQAFNLERSLSFAASYDGKLGFFGNVSETNRTLSGMHHPAAKGAHEEIAFPGFSALLLASVALVLPARRELSRLGSRQAWNTILIWSTLVFTSGLVSLLGRSMLSGSLVFCGGAWLLANRRVPQPFGGARGVYLAVLLLALVLFLGLEPMTWYGEPVHGLYYYFYRHFPGFDGIRKVSRQAVMSTFAVCILAGFGAAWLFSQLKHTRTRPFVFAGLLVALSFELRCFPHPLEAVWASDQVPALVHFVGSLPAQDLIAFAPQNGGRTRFRGDAGMALYNYLSLYHGHRFVNGQSSFQPPVSELARRALEHLPDDGARRSLLAIGTRHIALFGGDLAPSRAMLPAALAARPEEYHRVFQQGEDTVFTLLAPDERSLEPIEPPPLPERAQLIPENLLRASSPLEPELSALAVDGNPVTFWTTARAQEPGQYFEVQLPSPRPLIALEIRLPGRVMDAPISYRLSAARGGEELGVVAEQPVLRFFRAQIFSPETFLFRVVLPKSTLADRLRITVQEPVPGQYFSINELRLYERSDR